MNPFVVPLTEADIADYQMRKMALFSLPAALRLFKTWSATPEVYADLEEQMGMMSKPPFPVVGDAEILVQFEPTRINGVDKLLVRANKITQEWKRGGALDKPPEDASMSYTFWLDISRDRLQVTGLSEEMQPLIDFRPGATLNLWDLFGDPPPLNEMLQQESSGG